jgi:hypothetical protein
MAFEKMMRRILGCKAEEVNRKREFYRVKITVICPDHVMLP